MDYSSFALDLLIYLRLLRRPVLAQFGEKIGFQEVFGARQYMSFLLPASVLALLHESPVRPYNTPRRLFERFVFFETRGLAARDYALIALALQRLAFTVDLFIYDRC